MDHRSVPDLSRARMPDLEARKAQEGIETSAGMRCGGCGRRIRVGMKFYSIDPRAEVPTQMRVACNRDDCSFMEECRPHATVMEMIEYAWLDASGADAPPALWTERLKRDATPTG